MTPATDPTGGSALWAIHTREPSSSHSRQREPRLRSERLLTTLVMRDTPHRRALSGEHGWHSLKTAHAGSVNPLRGQTTNRRAGCGKSACPVRREGGLSTSPPYLYPADDLTVLNAIVKRSSRRQQGRPFRYKIRTQVVHGLVPPKIDPELVRFVTATARELAISDGAVVSSS